MATSKSQRVAAFLLASLFLLSTIGATVYVVWQINQEDSGIIEQTEQEKAALAEAQKAVEKDPNAKPVCREGEHNTVAARPIPKVTKQDGPITKLKKIDIKVGSGDKVQAGDCVAALYYGTLAKDGTKFDGNYESGAPIEFSLNGVIAGWTEGIPGMKVGGVRRLLIPSDKAYGETGQGPIPANSDLIFEVEIVATRRGD